MQTNEPYPNPTIKMNLKRGVLYFFNWISSMFSATKCHSYAKSFLKSSLRHQQIRKDRQLLVIDHYSLVPDHYLYEFQTDTNRCSSSRQIQTNVPKSSLLFTSMRKKSSEKGQNRFLKVATVHQHAYPARFPNRPLLLFKILLIN